MTIPEDFEPLATEVRTLKDAVILLHKDLMIIHREFSRIDIDTQVPISSTMPYTINKFDRKFMYFFSPIPFTATVEDLGIVNIPANTWTDMTFGDSIRVFAQGQSSIIYVLARCTDRKLV